jgi:hypothetical protein
MRQHCDDFEQLPHQFCWRVEGHRRFFVLREQHRPISPGQRRGEQQERGAGRKSINTDSSGVLIYNLQFRRPSPRYPVREDD